MTVLAGICVGPRLRETIFSSLRETTFLVGMLVGSSPQRDDVFSLVKNSSKLCHLKDMHF